MPCKLRALRTAGVAKAQYSLGDAKEVVREATKHKQDIDDNDIMTDRKGPQNPQGWFLKHSAQT